MIDELKLPRVLDDSLVLRTVESDAEAEKVIAINAATHGSDTGAILRHWFFKGHPFMSRNDWLFVEDQVTDEAVATLSLMNTTWLYSGKDLPVAELGFVATRPDYRRRGLQRVLSDTFDQMALDRGFSLAAIEGIPGFYGQFGYEYAVPLVGGVDLELEQVPDKPDLSRYTTRKASGRDASVLQRLYDASIAELDIAAPRGSELWNHQLVVPDDVTFYGSTTVIEAEGKIVGYLRWSDDDWTDRLRILELAVDEGRGARERIVVALRFACEQAQLSNKRGLRLQLPANHPAVRTARYMGGVDTGFYGWQMKILDPVGFLWAVSSALETRLERSLLAGYSGPLVFQLYRSRLALRFEEGKLVEANAGVGDEEPDIRLTRKHATQLWLGWRGRRALEEWYPDFWSRNEARELLDVLFPEARAYIYTPY